MKRSRCRSCGYRWDTRSNAPYCQYILIAGNHRPCPGGPGCRAWESEETVKKKYGARLAMTAEDGVEKDEERRMPEWEERVLMQAAEER